MSASLSIRYFLQRTGRSCCGLTRLTKLWGVALHRSLSTMSPRQIESQLKNNSTMQSSSSRFNFESMNPDELDNFFRAAEISNANISAHFNRLADCLNRISAVVLPSNVARAAYALRNSRLEDPGVTKMLEAVRLKLVACQGRFSEVQVCKCIAAVRNMGGDQPDVLQIIAIITSKIKDLDGQLQNRAFGTILYSLKNMRSEPAQVRELLAVVAESMENYEKPLDGQCIGNSLFGLRGMSSEHIEVRKLVSAIAFKIPEVQGIMKPQELGNALYGLQRMSSDKGPVREVLAALSAQLHRYLSQVTDEDVTIGESISEDDLDAIFDENYNKRSKIYSLSGQELSNALYGCQTMSDEHRDTRRLLIALLPALRNPSSPFNAQAVGNAIYGLGSMSCKHEEIRKVVSVLADRVQECIEPLNSQSLSNALYGLKCMKSSTPEVRKLLLVIANKIETMNKAPLSAQSVGNALYGLQCMSSEHQEVRQLLRALSTKIELSDVQLNSQAVGNALYGMSGMNSQTEEVKNCLRVLSGKIRSSSEPLSGQAISNALYGLQNMSSKEAEVREIVATLTEKIHNCTTPANAQIIGNALYGLKMMSSSDGHEVRLLVDALVQYIFDSTKCYDGNGDLILNNCERRNQYDKYLLSDAIKDAASDRGVIPLNNMAFSMALFGLQGMSSENVEIRNLLLVLMPSFKTIAYNFSGQCAGNALYGLQTMSSDVPEVLSLLRLLIDQLTHSAIGIMSEQEISNAFFGLRNMESCDETDRILSLLAYQLQESSDTFMPLSLAQCTLGLQNMTGTAIVREILLLLRDRVTRCTDPFDANTIGTLCYGLKNIDECDAPEVGLLLNDLADITTKLNLKLAPHNCANILYGLSSCTFAGKRMIELALIACLKLHEEMSKLDSMDGIFSTYEFGQCLILTQSLELLLESDNFILDPKLRGELEAFRSLLCDKLGSYQPVSVKIGSTIENIIHDALQKELLGPLKLSQGELLHSFESDIVVRVQNGSGKLHPVVNIEVDGAIHRSPTKRQFCRRRDCLLRNRGVRVIRLSVWPAPSDEKLKEIVKLTANQVREIFAASGSL